MKKLFISIVALCAVFNLSAQNKGEKYVGGNLGIATTSFIVDGESASAIKFAIAPEFGYFVADNWKVGAEVGFTTAGNRVSIMPNAAYYLRIVDKLYYTPGVAVGASFAKGANSFNLDLRLGAIEFQPAKNMALSMGVANLTYSRMHKTNNIAFELLYAPTVGFRYYF